MIVLIATQVINAFGGYEKVKAVLESPTASLLHNTVALKRHLLTYRRENKIFEVGDKVIYYILGNGVIEYEEWLSTQDKSCIRHATDKEIEAGKRLD